MGNSPKGEYMLNIRNMLKMLGMGSLCLFLLGCSEESFFVQEESSTVILEEEIILSQKEDEELNLLQKDAGKHDTTGTEDAEQNAVIEESHSLPKDSGENDGNHDSRTEGKIAVHICGAVNQVGVYYFAEGQRVCDAIQKAGGFREDAEQNYLNQAMVLEDGMKIIVPTKEDIRQLNLVNENEKKTDRDFMSNEKEDIFIQKNDASKEAAMAEGFLQGKKLTEVNANEIKSGKVDLNTADEALLCTLPGIGESRAKSIIAYREEHGLFQKPEDVMNVSGIKEAAYEKMKEYVTVSGISE